MRVSESVYCISAVGAADRARKISTVHQCEHNRAAPIEVVCVAFTVNSVYRSMHRALLY